MMNEKANQNQLPSWKILLSCSSSALPWREKSSNSHKKINITPTRSVTRTENDDASNNNNHHHVCRHHRQTRKFESIHTRKQYQSHEQKQPSTSHVLFRFFPKCSWADNYILHCRLCKSLKQAIAPHKENKHKHTNILTRTRWRGPQDPCLPNHCTTAWSLPSHARHCKSSNQFIHENNNCHMD